VDVTKILQATKARDHNIFTGKLVKCTSASPTRPWPPPSAAKKATSATGPEIREWTTSVAHTLLPS
jgi:hypothetical protein